MILPAFYAKPGTTGRVLDVGPDTGPARSAAFVEDAGRALAEDLRALTDPLALSLDVGLPGDVPLLGSNNLDHYVYPLVRGLTATTGRTFVSVWATKKHTGSSSVAVYQPRRTPDPRGPHAFQARTTASIITTDFREQIRRPAAAARPLPDGAVALQIAFAVGPRRAWPNLWRVTIGSLDPLLGRGGGAGERSVRDGRVTELGLHCVVDPALGHDVLIAVRARPASA
jgi:hypothetical protein